MLGLLFTYRKSPLSRTVEFIVLFVSIISFTLVARTGYLGGQIRHTEISETAAQIEEIEKEVD
jgi:uncharacterized membrane protein